MPEKWDSCIKKVKRGLRADNPKWSDDKVDKSAYKVCAHLRKPEGENLRIKTISEIYEYEKEIENPDFDIHRAKLAFVTDSKNFVRYTKEALTPLISPYSLDHTGGYDGAPLLLNHDIHKVENTIGRVTDIRFENDALVANLNIMKGTEIAEKVKLGLIKNVSFHNTVQEVDCSVCNKPYGTECQDHVLGNTYGEDVCHIVPRQLGAVEVSLVTFGGITGAMIGETLEGFDERYNVDTKEDTTLEDEIEDVISDVGEEDKDTSNDSFISEETKESNRKLSKEKGKDKIDKILEYNREAKKMSENEQELQLKQKLEKLELEKKSLEETVKELQETVQKYQDVEKERIETEKQLLIGEMGTYVELTDEKVKEYQLFEVSALKEFLDIVKKSSTVSEGEELLLKAKVTDTGKIKDPLKQEVEDYLERTL